MVNRRKGQKRKASYKKETPSKKRKDDDGNIPDNLIDNTESDLLSLPDEVLIKIVKHVSTTQWPSLEGISRRFRKAVYEAWHRLEIIRLGEDFLIDDAQKEENATRVLDLILKKLVCRAPNTTAIGGFSNIVSSNISNTTIRWLSRFGNLRSVDFLGSKIRLNVLANFLETSTSRGQLKELAIGTLVEPLRVRQLESSFLVFGNENSNLPVLQLENFALTENFGFCNWQFLDTMDVSRLTMFNAFGGYLSFRDLISLIGRATNLTNLAFGWFFQSGQNEGGYLAQCIRILKAIATSENLVSLKITDNFFALESLEFNSDFVAMIAELGRRRRLEELSLLTRSFCIDEIVSAIGVNMPHLKSLELAPHKNATKEPFIRLIKKLKQLEKLRLELDFGRVVDDEVISTIATNLFDLQCFHLINGYSNEQKLTTLKDLAVLHNLKELRIKNIDEVDTPTMTAWGDGFGSNLETLEFLGRTRITENGLMALVDKAPRLRQLTIEGVTSSFTNRFGRATLVTGCRLGAIVASCRDLREFNLKSFEQEITIDGVQAIVDGCPRLKRISGIRGHGLQMVKLEKYRKVKFD